MAAQRVAANLQQGQGRPGAGASILKSSPSVIGSKSAKADPLDPHRKGSAWSITNMPAEIAQFAIDKPFFSENVKAADIARHGKDEQLDAFNRALLCLGSKDINQKVYAVQSLFSLVITDEQRAFKEVVPGIETELRKNFDPELHRAASDSFAPVINDLLKKNPQHGKQLVQLAASFASCNDIEISETWYNCFDSLSDLITSADLQRELVPQITERFGKPSTHANGRRVAARLINKLSKRLPEEVLAKRLLPVVENLMQDVDPGVRGSMVTRMPEILSRLKNKDKVVSLLQNFSTDGDPYLMGALVGALGKSCALINPKDPQASVLYQATIPIVKKLVKKAFVDGNVNILTEFSAHMGQMTLVFAGAGALTPGDKLWFLDAFLQLSRYGLPPTYHKGNTSGSGAGAGPGHDMPTGFMNFRANMEFNRRNSLIESLISSGIQKLPTNAAGNKGGLSNEATLSLLKGNNNVAVPVKSATGTNQSQTRRLSFAIEQSEESWICRANAASGFFHFLKFAKPLVDFRNGLHPMMVDLMHDPVPGVRVKMAQNLHPVMSFLGNEGSILHGEVVYALSDDNISVIEGVLPNLAEILKLLVQSKLISPDSMTNTMVEIGGALLFCEERLSQSNDWRVHAIMLEQMSVLPFCLPGDYVYNNFVPALFHRLLHMRQLPCRIAAADAIVSFLRHCRRSSQRDDIQRRMKEGFAAGRSVHDRMLFLFMSKKIMEMFSRKYYRDNFFETTLALTDDTVANIRMKAVTMMPDLKGVLQMSEDPSLLKKLEETLQRIKNSETDRDVQNAIEAVIPEMAKIGVVFKTDKKVQKTKEDLEDEAKEKEEAYIASLEPTTGAANLKDRRRSLFKTSKRHSEPPAQKAPAPQQPPPPPPPPAAPPKPVQQSTQLPPVPQNQPQQTKTNPFLVQPVISTDNTKLALHMKGHHNEMRTAQKVAPPAQSNPPQQHQGQSTPGKKSVDRNKISKSSRSPTTRKTSGTSKK